jgi:dihydrofolate reductase
MGRVHVFLNVTLDGCFAGPNGEIDFFKAIPKDAGFEKYTHAQSSGGSTLIFGRKTYDMMRSYWPTPQAIADDPGMAKVVDHSPKIVFSTKLRTAPEEPNWTNVTLLHQIEAADLARRKNGRGDFTILGSGSIVRQFAKLGLIDEYTFVMVPVVLGDGQRLFQDFDRTGMKLLESKSFDNGLAVLRYRPA